MIYHKIDSVYKRDPNNNYKTFLVGEWTRPEFEYLACLEWEWTEKIDGTNIRIGIGADQHTIGGRTQNAQIPTFLVPVLAEIGMRAVAAELEGLTLCGEGYGPKIQNGGDYRKDHSFILFDVFTDAGMALTRRDVEDIAAKVGIDVVPVVGVGNLYQAIREVMGGFDSVVARSPLMAEGLVVRPATELRCRNGGRVITKIKTRDFGG